MEIGVRNGDAAVTTRGVVPTPREESVALARLTAPLAAAFIAEMAMSVTDTLIVGHLGSVQLGAVGLTANLVFLGLSVSMHVLSIVGVLVAQNHAAGDDAAAAHAVRMGFWVATLVSVPAMLFCWYIAPVLRLFQQQPDVIVHAEAYARTVMWCLPSYLYFTVLRNFVTSLSRANSIMVITFASVPLNFAANYVLVFGAFGFPAMGVAGAGVGTSFVCAVMFLAIAWHVWRDPTLRAFHVFADLLTPHWQSFREILRVGWSAGAISAVEGGLFATVSVLLGVIGANALAAGQIAFSCITVPFMVVYALSTAASVRVAHGVGSGSMTAAQQAGRLSIAFGLCYMAAVAVVLWLFPDLLAGLFLEDANPDSAEVAGLAAAFLAIAAVFQIFDGTQIVVIGALRGFKDTTVPFFIGLVGYWAVGLGSGYVFAFELGHGGIGLWWGLALGLAASASLLVLRFHLRTSALMRAEAVAA
jgi:MATE family multidrug resistance protein